MGATRGGAARRRHGSARYRPRVPTRPSPVLAGCTQDTPPREGKARLNKGSAQVRDTRAAGWQRRAWCAERPVAHDERHPGRCG
ncbi:hypothetical protein MOPEL_084_00120 [Mobilicoccus pelagius NBRC 104925]|uniref:Uncharacterized protein n=1 Tax=Mobilicoccus pelagius NBRC 104925 TaxID=1089455 RepID=H5UT20_9MICO|nr:hypothetical protein MOPEL_084_00120 [Mobilicoccus pelagius NBRC 104925]